MFGVYRAILALMVVTLHIGGIPWLGGYAVFAFYTLSGYLMTLIIQKTYGYNYEGIRLYFLNRFLRIFPIYWVSALFTLCLIYIFNESYVAGYHKAMLVPESWVDILKNIFLFFPNAETVRLTPPAWALTVELCFYILIAFGLSKSSRVSVIWLGFSILYHVIAWNQGYDRYSAFFAASLPFSVGAVIYFYRERLLDRACVRYRSLPSYLPILLLFLMVLNWYVGDLLHDSLGVFFYVNIVISAITILVLSSYRELPWISRGIDQWVGDFSYPIYLIHYQVALLVLVGLQTWGVDVNRPNILLMWVSIPFIFLVSWLLMVSVERPIERLRSRIKEKL